MDEAVHVDIEKTVLFILKNRVIYDLSSLNRIYACLVYLINNIFTVHFGTTVTDVV